MKDGKHTLETGGHLPGDYLHQTHDSFFCLWLSFSVLSHTCGSSCRCHIFACRTLVQAAAQNQISPRKLAKSLSCWSTQNRAAHPNHCQQQSLSFLCRWSSENRNVAWMYIPCDCYCSTCETKLQVLCPFHLCIRRGSWACLLVLSGFLRMTCKWNLSGLTQLQVGVLERVV